MVLYYPDLCHLEEFVESLSSQCAVVYLIDNTPNNDIDYDGIKTICSGRKNVEHIVLGGNLGIAYAHNIGLKKFINSNNEYVIIFDQDSYVEKDFINRLLSQYYILRNNGYDIAAIGPAFRDTKTKLISPAIQIRGLKVNRVKIDNSKNFTESDYIISSGTLIEKKSLEIIGLMMEELFIDYVDVEWGLRAKKLGYKCFISNNVIMTHTIGDTTKYIPILKRNVNVHSDFRKYFLLRNPVYLIVHGKDLPLNWKLIQIPKVFLYFIFVLIYVKADLNMFQIFLKATKDAFLKKMYKGSV